MIAVQNLCRSYGNFKAVDDLSFSVKPGEILGLVGPNGAGKTTSLRVLAGILPASSGNVSLYGHDIAEQALAAKRITGYVPDNPKLFDTLTVWEHLDLTASLYQINSFETVADNLLAQFNLTDKKDTPAQSLSLGMRQKLAICCAYLYSPSVLIFDEPLTGLDPRGMAATEQSIKERASTGTCVIISSHLLSLVEGLCSHVLIIDEGKSRLSGSMQDIVQRFDADSDSNSPESLESVFLRITEKPDDKR